MRRGTRVRVRYSNLSGVGTVLRQMFAPKRQLMLVFFVPVFLASSMIPVYGPWIAQAQAAQKFKLMSSGPLDTAKQKTVVPTTDGITPEAKATAVPAEDPVLAYQKEQEEQKGKPAKSAKILPQNEIKEKRTAFSNTYLNTEGGLTERIYADPVNYKANKGRGPWEPIAGTLKDDTKYNESESAKESLISRLLPGKPFVKRGLRQDNGLVRGTFRPLTQNEGITIGFDGTASFNVALLGANQMVNPELGTFDDGLKYVLYKDAWKNADVYYEQRGTSLKETIVLKTKDVPTTFGFKFNGAQLSYGTDDKGVKDGTIVAVLSDGNKVVIPQLSIVSKVKGPLNEPKMHYELDGDVVRVVLDAKWFKTLPADVFPIIVDPTYDWRGVSTGIPGGDYGQFIAYDSRGYGCNSNICDVYAGSLNDGGWKNWRTMMRLPLTSVYGQSVSWANIYTERVSRPNAWNGFNGNRPYEITWAHCFGYNCFSGAPRATTWLDWAGNFDATALMQWVSTNNIGDGWLMIKAVNEGDINSFKSFAGSRTYLDVNFRHWNQQTALPTLAEPAQNAVIPVSRPTLKINGVGDPDGDLVRYAFHLLDSKGNVIAHSGELDTPWWTIPDDVLVDGETYSWRAFVMERNASNPSVVESGWRQQPEVRSFKFDLRTGKDKTQSYDEVGPLSVSLNRGNAYTGANSHTIGALGGSIGVGLDYNTPELSRYGLTGYYYNETSSGRKHAITVKDPNVDMAWGTGSPYPGTMQNDNFTINWQGFFVAPEDGTYSFGATRDDNMSMSITHDGITDLQFDYTCCGWNMSSKTVNLKKGQAYPISVWYFEFGGAASAHLDVKLPNGNIVRVPSEWLRTLPDAGLADNKGLTARFYKTDVNDNPNFVIKDNTPLVFTTKVPQVNRDWGTGSLLPYEAAGVYYDFMIVNYSGFLTIPADGKYQIGGGSDDGLRIRLGGKEVANSWSPHGYLETWSPEMEFKAGQVLPISIDYFEYNGAASANLQWKSSTNSVNTGIIPGQYLSTAPKVVPQGWNMSVDPDSNIPYEALQAKSSGNVDLIDSDGFVHAYTWTGSGFKPPVDEGGYLIRNADGTYTLTDTDGRVYNFSAEGLIVRVSSPLDDRSPAALQYEYRDTSTTAYGSLPKLSRIKDGVDPTHRYGQLYYWGEQDASSVCTVLAGFDTPQPGYLCAFKTFPDERVTTFAYKGGQLARIQQPGSQAVDYAYEADGRLKQIRDTLANDAISVGMRASDGTETTQITYDDLRRVSKVLLPAPFGATVPAGQSNDRTEHTFEYGFQATKRQVTGAPKPAGYQQYIEYDNLYRTTKACSHEGLCNISEYDPAKDLLLSVTDHLGLKSTTIYDIDDRPITQYGPAPVAAFKADRTPVDLNQVPRTDTKYDEGIVGTSVAWYNAKGSSLVGAPKLHTTGIDPADTKHQGRDFRQGAPITPDADMDGYGFSATGKIRFPGNGTYTFKVWHDDGVRLWIDDKLVIDDWAYRSEGIAQASPSGTFVAEAGKSYRYRFDYIHVGSQGGLEMWTAGPGITDTNNGLGTSRPSFINPGYNLQTSQVVYDAELGNKTSTTEYGTMPEFGLPTQTTSSGGGLSFTTSTAYESPGAAGSFLRKTSNTLPGGTTTKYEYYNALEKVDNPCTPDVVDEIYQGGQLRTKVSLDPDGAGPQTGLATTTVYDNAGRPIATRTDNSGPWSCTEYDERGRTVRAITPEYDGRAGRTLTSNYAVNGNPFIRSVNDTSTGTVTVEVDLLGRVLKSTDTFGYETKLTYDSLGRVSKKQSLKGTETATYDEYSRPTSYILDGVTYATMTYDSLGRLANVEYPQATNGTGTFKLSQIKRDISQQGTGATYTFSDGSTYDETVRRTMQTGLVTGNTITQGGKTVTNSYQYDGVGRLTSATIDNWKYDYAFGDQEVSCATLPGFNANASKNGNRTSATITNLQTGTATTTTSCYNAADQLISSTDEQVGVPTYDSHGNITQLAGAGTPITFTYNASDQNIAISQGGNKVEYTKDAAGNVLVKKEYRNGELDKVYRNASGALLTCKLTDQTDCGVLDRYVGLPGAVAMTLTNTSATEPKAAYSIQNFHGDSAMIANETGLPASSVSLYDPFGGNVVSVTFGTSTAPENASDISMGWATSPSRKQEKLFSVAIMQMGARIYMPSLGRFLQADPVEGGTPSAYVYVLDPINFADYNGQWGIPKWVKVAAIVVVVAVVVVGVVAACIAVCAVVGAAIASAATAVASAAATMAATAAVIGIRAAPVIARVGSAVASSVVKVGSKAAPVVSKGVSVAQQVARSNAPARLSGPVSAGEKGKIGIQNAGIVQNTKSILAPSGRVRIPDELTMQGSRVTRIGEVKNVQSQSLTSQIRDYIAIAQENQITLNLYINSNAKLSGPLQKMIDDGTINMIPY